MGDEELLRLLRRRPEAGMRALMEQYAGLVCAVVGGTLPAARFCAADREGCVADTFSEFYLDLAKYDPSRGSVKSWLCALAKHNALDLARQRRGDTLPLEEGEWAGEESPELELEDREDRAAVLAAVRALGEPDREIVTRKYYLGQSSKEIAARLGLTAANVDTRTHRAVERLRKVLKEGGTTR